VDDEVGSVSLFWQTVPFFGSRLEDLLQRYWYVAIALSCGSLVWYGWLTRSSSPEVPSSITSILKNPFMASFYIALILSMIAYKFWQLRVRKTFSQAIDNGIVDSLPAIVHEFHAASKRFQCQLKSRYRFLPVVVMMLATIMFFAPKMTGTPDSILQGEPADIVFVISFGFSLLLFSYAIGAVAWTLMAAATWISSISRAELLQIQAGHSDNCCGLEEIGTCCLQSAVPLLVGMVLCLVWSYGLHLPFFRAYPGLCHDIAPFSSGLMATLFILACVLVFLPVRGLHMRLEMYRRTQERHFTEALARELTNIRNLLPTDNSDHIKTETDRLKLVTALDPEVLKLRTWPFDTASLIKFGVTPIITLAASLGKDAFNLLK